METKHCVNTKVCLEMIGYIKQEINCVLKSALSLVH
jgi:hypothetical protein